MAVVDSIKRPGTVTGEAFFNLGEAMRLKFQKAQQAQREPMPGVPAEVVSALRLTPVPWPEVVRGVPNMALRSALFGAIKPGKRRYIEGELIAAVDDIQIRYTGPRLDQGDLDVWESVLHLYRLYDMGMDVSFSAYSLLKLMGKTDTGENRKTLHVRLMRLKATAVEVKQGRYSYAGSLLDDVSRDEQNDEYVININRKLVALFERDAFTLIQWEVRHTLNRKQLAQWLHGFYSSHAKPFPMKVETLHRLSGSEAARMRDFKAELRRALDAVAAACTAAGQPFSYEIRGDLVYIDKEPTASQRRHLAKSRARPKK